MLVYQRVTPISPCFKHGAIRRRIFLLRTLAAFVLQTAARLPAASSGASLELPELMEALQKTFQQTYDAQVSMGWFGDLEGLWRGLWMWGVLPWRVFKDISLTTSGIMPSACHAHDGELMGIIYTVILYDPTVTTVNRARGRWSCWCCFLCAHGLRDRPGAYTKTGSTH